MAELDYDELVQGTIDEVKEAVEEEDLDPEKVLEAEKANKNRVTLVEWLEERADDSVDEEPVAAVVSSGGDSSVFSQTLNAVTNWLFLAGLMIGAAVSIAVLSSGMGVSGVSGSAPTDHVESYFSQNAEGIPLQRVSVESSRLMEGSSLYRLDMVLYAEFLNRTIEQNQTAIVTSDGRYLFLGAEPLDTERPLAEQMGQGAAQ